MASPLKFPAASLVVVLTAFIVFLCPGAQELLVLDRQAILQGEWWRLFTGHFVHFSSSHLVLDSLVLLVAGTLVERCSRKHFTLLLLATMLVASAGMLLLLPGLHLYGGLSSAATAMLFFIALRWTGHRGLRGRYGWLVITGMVAKLVFECGSERALFAGFGSSQIRPVPLAHAVGILCALIVWILDRLDESPVPKTRGRALHITRLEGCRDPQHYSSG